MGRAGSAAGDRPPGAEPAGMNQGMQVLSYLISGVGFYGLVGWLLDRWLGTGFLLPVGLVLGAGLALYLVIRRYSAGLEPPSDGSTGAGTTTKGRT